MKWKPIVLVLIGFAACDAPPSDVPRDIGVGESTTRIRTDATEYSLRRDDPGWTTAIGFTYRAGADTVYIVNCNGAILMNLQKREVEGWRDEWHAEGNACLSPPIVISPGEVFRSEVLIWGTELDDPSYNSFRTPEIDGEYRLVWSQPVHHYDPKLGSFGDTIPLAERLSNPFTLERASAER
jgi:hypothetical protein